MQCVLSLQEPCLVVRIEQCSLGEFGFLAVAGGLLGGLPTDLECSKQPNWGPEEESYNGNKCPVLSTDILNQHSASWLSLSQIMSSLSHQIIYLESNHIISMPLRKIRKLKKTKGKVITLKFNHVLFIALDIQSCAFGWSVTSSQPCMHDGVCCTEALHCDHTLWFLRIDLDLHKWKRGNLALQDAPMKEQGNNITHFWSGRKNG